MVVEFDGREKYVSPTEGGGPRRDPLFEEKRREDAIRDEMYEFLRVTWRQQGGVAAIGRRIEAAPVYERADASRDPGIVA